MVACLLLTGIGAIESVDPPSGASMVLSYTTVATPVALPHDAHQLGPLQSRTSVQLTFALQPRNPTGLASMAAKISTPGSVQFHRYLSPSVIAARYGPTGSVIAQVTTYARSLGFTVGHLSGNHLLLSVDATATTVAIGLHAHLMNVRLSNGRIGWRTTSNATLPESIAHDVTAVVGLNNISAPHALEIQPASKVRSQTSKVRVTSKTTSSAPNACSRAQLSALRQGGWTDNQIADAYGVSRLYSDGDLALGQTIAVVELEPFSMSDIAAFDSCYFGESHTKQVHRVRVDGFHLVGPGSGESALDIESLSAMAPQATIDVYEAPNTTFGTLDDYNEIVSRDSANIITTSWGECEQMLDMGSPGARQAENFIFEEAAAQGQTFIAATGDSGSDDCGTTPYNSPRPISPYLSVDDPASQPYVLAVGGTSLESDTQPLSVVDETAWNGGSAGGATGGGVSSSWPSPSWQADSGIPGVSTTANRQVPDVSASADSGRGITVYSTLFGSDGWATIGGTSESSPLWAAILAEIAASGSAGTSCSGLPTKVGGPDLGFIPPLLYGVASQTSATSFHSIVVGNNDAYGLGLGYYATPGFNLVGGLGSPIVTDPNGQPGLASSLCNEALATSQSRPVITSLTPSYGPLGGGTTVAITLAQPLESGAQVAVSFDSAPAPVLSSTGSLITVSTPAGNSTPGAPSFSGAGPAVVNVTETLGGRSISTIVAPGDIFGYVNENASTTSIPTVSEVNPGAGNNRGGNSISVYGSGFTSGLPTVRIGGRIAPVVRVISDYLLTVTVPRKSSATLCASGAGFERRSLCQTSVLVTTPAGTSTPARVLPDRSGSISYNTLGVIARSSTRETAPAVTEYDYAPTPTIRTIEPAIASSTGRTEVSIIGEGFSLNTLEWVNFGPATSVDSQQLQIKYISGTRIELRVPAHRHLAGETLPGGVSVQSAAGLSNSKTFRYTALQS